MGSADLTQTRAPLLASVISISRQFLRSTRIDADFGREDALSGYVCQGTARSLLESMARHLTTTRQRAFTWTGPYGGGKSSLALMLCSLVGPNQRLRQRAKQILDLPDNSPVHSAFDTRGDGWLVLPIVGKRTSVVQELSIALARARGGSGQRRKKTDVVGELVAAAESHRHGVLVVVDELGKFLEASAQGAGDDVYFFQQLAEAASRTRGKLVVVGILHQAFDAYATRLGREARDEWAKVQGRFVDIPLVAASDEVIELIGRAINVDGAVIDTSGVAFCVHEIAKAIRARRPGTPATIEQSLAKCWPLHPVTAALLGPISKRKFGQNERSTFGFLASREPNGFMEFLEGSPAEVGSMYEPARYWDYLCANLEPAILASPDGHRWAVAVDAVERAEAKGEALHVAVTKTVALIEMFRNGSGLVAEDAVLCMSVRGAPTVAAVRRALQDLVQWKILIERRHLGAYGVFAGSDFDVEGAIAQARGEIGTPSLEHISALSDLQPILAKRLYAETGTMRWFTRRIVRMPDLERTLSHFKRDKGSVGSFVLCLPDIDQSERSADAQVRRVSVEMANVPVVLGAPSNASRIAELSLELAAAERVVKSRPELEGDSVARREMIGRVAAVRGLLEEELTDAFRLSKWYWQGERQGVEKSSSLSAVASKIAGSVYPAAPRIFSELLNREDPSSNANKARKDLMYQMVRYGNRANLNYDGYPADAGLYYTILQTAGLHRPQGDDGWGFREPYAHGDRGPAMEPLWTATRALVAEAGKETTVANLYAFWSAPPYGVRAGVMPVLALAFYLAHRSLLAMYIEGVFTPELTEAVIDDWLQDPSRIKLQYVAASKDQASLVKAIAQSVSEQAHVSIPAVPLDAARALVGMVMALPAWTRRTLTVSQSAQDVRAMLLKASDPHKVLFADLPTLLKASSSQDVVARLRKVTEELSKAYGSMLDSVRRHLLAALDHVDRPLADLRARAATVKGITGEFRLDAFAARLEAYDGSDEAVEGLVSLAVSKPSANWVDRDIDAALLQLGTWALEFRRAETMAPLRGRPSTRRVIGVVFGAGTGHDASGSVDVSESDKPAIDQLVKELLVTMREKRPEIVLAALAEAGVLLVNQKSKEQANG
jgi:hypothetical protein